MDVAAGKPPSKRAGAPDRPFTVKRHRRRRVDNGDKPPYRLHGRWRRAESALWPVAACAAGLLSLSDSRAVASPSVLRPPKDALNAHGDRRSSHPAPASAGRADLSRSPRQCRSRAGPARRDPDQQRRLRPGVGFPAQRTFRRGDSSPHLRDRGHDDPSGQARDADHAENLSRRPRSRRRDRPPISGAARDRRDHDHQRLRLRAQHL